MRAAILLVALAAAGCGQPSGPREGAQAPQAAQTSEHRAPPLRPERLSREAAGQPAPDVALERDPAGATETLAEIAREARTPVLVNLWATWCAPCLKELPTLDRLAEATRGRLAVVPISQDVAGWRAVTPAFTPQRYPHLATRVDSRMAFGQAVGADALPLTILYDAEGREVWRYVGDLDWMSEEARALLGV